jgi:hypothetical protein
MFYHMKHYAKISTVESKTHYGLQNAAALTATVNYSNSYKLDGLWIESQ